MAMGDAPETSDLIDRRTFFYAAATIVATRRTFIQHRLPALLSPPMITRRIPRTGEELPVIGMGTWQTFDPSPASPAALDRLSDVLRVFIEGGGRVVDSSPMYGRAEEHAGALLD